MPPLGPLDHVAIVVPDTEAALAVWRDRVGLPVLFTEVIQGGAIRLTHLDLGNTHLQLVEPLTADHPLQLWLAEHGPGLHHLCWQVDDVAQAGADLAQRGLPPAEAQPHQAPQGKRALFMERAAAGGVQVELTGK